MPRTPKRAKAAPAEWTFLTNYAHVLVCLSTDPGQRMRDLAEKIGITERAVQRIVRDLIEAGFLVVSKDGRCNRYTVIDRNSLRHPLEAHRTVRDLLTLVR